MSSKDEELLRSTPEPKARMLVSSPLFVFPYPVLRYLPTFSCVKQLCSPVQIRLAHDVVALKHAPRRVSCHLHRNTLGYSRSNQITYSCAAKIM